MIISHYGLGFVKIQLGERVIAFNPIGDTAATKPVKFGADIALVSLRSAGYNGVKNVSRGERIPFVVDGPGEYEVEGVFIKGLAGAGADGTVNTVYTVLFDGVRIVHAGALVSEDLSAKAKGEIGAVDILFVPVGGGAVLDSKQAVKLITALEPSMVIPVHYDAAALTKFLKDSGAESAKPVESLQVKKKDLVGKEAEVVVVQSW